GAISRISYKFGRQAQKALGMCRVHATPLELGPRSLRSDVGRCSGVGGRSSVIPTSRVHYSNLGTRPRVLVPVLMGQKARPAISIGDALASSPGGSGTLLGLVEIRTGRDNEVFAQEQRRRDMLRWMAGLEYDSDVRRRLRLSLRMTANPASSVRDAAAENEVTSMMLEWPTVESGRRH